MKSTPTPHTHTGVTAKELTLSFGPSGRMLHSATIPAGTACRKLDGGSDPWVVSDLRFMKDTRSIAYSDADIYGIRVPEVEIVDIEEVQWLSPRPRPRLR